MNMAIEIVDFPNKTSIYIIYHGFMMIIPSGKLSELEHDRLNIVDLPG